VIVLDTSALFALMNRRDRNHERVRAAFLHDGGPYLVPSGILSEITYLIEQRLGQRLLQLFLADLDEGAYTLDCGEGDLPRIRALVERYESLPLGFADASVIACAERIGGPVLTLDLRDFSVVAGEGRLQILLLA
jgi:uncharacterized protein